MSILGYVPLLRRAYGKWPSFALVVVISILIYGRLWMIIWLLR
jgi:hypothetical protein